MTIELTKEEAATVVLALMHRQDELWKLAARDAKRPENKAHWSNQYTKVQSVREKLEPLCE